MAGRTVMQRLAQRQGGFTLVELITVMVIVGILGAVGAARYADRATFDAAAYHEQMRAVIRYGQKVAVAQNRSIFVRLNGSSVALCFAAELSCSPANRVPAASGANSRSTATVAQCDGATTSAWACEGNPDGIAYAASANGDLFAFDAMGRPLTTVGAATGTITINLTGDGTTRTLLIEGETGYVH